MPLCERGKPGASIGWGRQQQMNADAMTDEQ